jgi:proteasome lid subunit RPN8/RPN11
LPESLHSAVPGMSVRTREAIYKHVFAHAETEVGGVLVGFRRASEPAVVSGFIPAYEAEGDITSLTFTHEAWEHIYATMETKHPDREIVGWYHSHPGHGIFLSGNDLFIHRQFFGDESNVAYVIDPQRGEEGIFGWREGAVVCLQTSDTLIPATSRSSRTRPENNRRRSSPAVLRGPERTPSADAIKAAHAHGGTPYPLLGYLMPAVLGVLLGVVIALALASDRAPTSGSATKSSRTTTRPTRRDRSITSTTSAVCKQAGVICPYERGGNADEPQPESAPTPQDGPVVESESPEGSEP